MSRSSAHRTGAVTIAATALLLLMLVVGVSAAAATTVTGGAASLLTDPGQSNTLFGGGAVPNALPGSTMALTGDAFRLTFPISSGSLNNATLAGSIHVKGGLQFWGRETMSAWTQLNFTKVVAALGVTSTVSGIYNAGGARHTILTLNLAHKTVTRYVKGSHHWVRIGNVKVAMSIWLSNQLKLAFPRYAPTTRFLGTVSFTVRL